MSRDDVEVVRRAFAAWIEGDLSALLSLLAEDLVSRRVAPLPDPVTYHGPEGLLQLSVEWIESFDEFSLDAEEFIDAGDHVLVRGRQTARGESSSAAVEATFWYAVSVSDGKIARFDIYGSREQALEAIGPQE